MDKRRDLNIFVHSVCGNQRSKRVTSRIQRLKRRLDANGMQNIFPNNLNLKSPGNFPIPSFCSQGSKLAKSVKHTRAAKTQRIIALPFL